MNVKKWIYSFALILCFTVHAKTEKLVVFKEHPNVQLKEEAIFEIETFKNLCPRIPSGKNLTYLRKTDFLNFGYKVKPLGGGLKSKIDDISKNEDIKGDKTEGIIDDLMLISGYTKLEGKYSGNKGFDGLYIKGIVKKPIEIVIIESKQFRYIKGEADVLIEHNGLILNPPNPSTGLPAQMSEDWINDVSQNLRNAGKSEIADMIDDHPNLIVKYVSAVDKALGEINFLKLDKY